MNVQLAEDCCLEVCRAEPKCLELKEGRISIQGSHEEVPSDTTMTLPEVTEIHGVNHVTYRHDLNTSFPVVSYRDGQLSSMGWVVYGAAKNHWIPDEYWIPKEGCAVFYNVDEAELVCPRPCRRPGRKISVPVGDELHRVDIDKSSFFGQVCEGRFWEPLLHKLLNVKGSIPQSPV
jgi:hypothetical protein